MALLGHFERRADLRILLGLDDEPAFVAVGREAADDRGEVERAVAGHGEGAFHHRVEKALLVRSSLSMTPLRTSLVWTWLMRL